MYAQNCFNAVHHEDQTEPDSIDCQSAPQAFALVFTLCNCFSSFDSKCNSYHREGKVEGNAELINPYLIFLSGGDGWDMEWSFAARTCRDAIGWETIMLKQTTKCTGHPHGGGDHVICRAHRESWWSLCSGRSWSGLPEKARCKEVEIWSPRQWLWHEHVLVAHGSDTVWGIQMVMHSRALPQSAETQCT